MRTSLKLPIPLAAVAAILLATFPERATAQAPSCTDYAACALGIAPRLTALDVVRGADETPAASLAFLWPRDVRQVFAGSAAGESHAGRAFGLRKIAATLTTLGVASGAASVLRATASHDRTGSATFGLAGLALFGASVPIHFAADAELSRAVWEYNRRFASDRR